ncbi:hypothetical protein P3X46_022508 [Hevea brasiliensis]|uniref:Srp40 C-terminal domain-containing protein n=1 Tax=Hevea brasiliensis TaxID=3981 RepID=A0ABQ9L9U7_HEVBR|nr:uncharacterized protein LOC110655598 isoform X1 [Hevea brasiliensis]KAJ9162759.1 hypothetical protein P3X46_022508 [Hevea brasiliensis]
MLKTQTANTANVNSNLLAFRPRQVVLRKPPSSMKQDDNKRKTLLIHSIAQYLAQSGFPKTLKKFRSETKLQEDELKDSSFDLEEIFFKFLDNCSIGDGEKKRIDKSAGDKHTNSKNAEETMTPDTLPVKSKEKKRNKKISCSLGEEEQVSTKNLKESTDDNVHESSVKKCKDKKKKCTSDSASLIDNSPLESLPWVVEEKSKDLVFPDGKKLPQSETENKSKDKKRKRNKLSSDPVIDEGKPNKIDSEKSDFQTPKEDATSKEKKVSKKRKRVASEEDAVQFTGEKLVEESKNREAEESKRRKKEGFEEPKIKEQSVELHSVTTTEEKVQKEESRQAGLGDSKQINGQSNGSLEENGEEFSSQKTMKKQQNGSAEPKTVKHFQRIKVDEVVLSAEKLKDNSYWAKDGAEDGYGAKAQEILGPVRGRDFRHEKTKKKRGTYRGGQIDLQSHSVKFNYSDDE